MTGANRIFSFLAGSSLALTEAGAGVAEGSFACEGSKPGWTLEFDDVQATFVFPAPTYMDVKHVARAENRDWPRAFTLIGQRDTAIVLIERQVCETASETTGYRAQVLTQRGETPILLTGCCRHGE